MQVVRAKTAGFCFGVSHALAALEKQLGQSENQAENPLEGQVENPKGRLITLGQIIHNPLVTEGYAQRGVLCVESIQGVQPGDRVVIRAHGVPQEIERALRETGALVVDATCPKVKKAQLAIAKESAKGHTLLLLGEPDHPEVRGLMSYAGQQALVFSSFEELAALQLQKDANYFLAAQTTQEKEAFARACEYLKGVLSTPFVELHTICDATKNRQDEVIALATAVQAMVVVGGLNSGNTRRLAHVAQAQGIPALHVEQVADVDVALLAGVERVGLTAGASTPDAHVDAMEAFLRAL